MSAFQEASLEFYIPLQTQTALIHSLIHSPIFIERLQFCCRYWGVVVKETDKNIPALLKLTYMLVDIKKQ